MWILMLACRQEPPVVPDEGEGLLGTGWANPFPSVHQLGPDGHLALRDLPDTDGTPIPVDRLAFRTGFSPAQVSVLRVEGIDPSGFPTLDDPVGGSIRMFDLTAGTELPCFAELDAFPEATEVATLIRPLTALPVGHRIGLVVVTAALARPERFDWLVSDTPPASLADVAPAYRALLAEVERWVPADQVALAWEFPVGDGTAPLTEALAQLDGWVSQLTLLLPREGPAVPPRTFRAVEGTYTVPNFLVDGATLSLDAAGVPAAAGEVFADLYVHLPASVADAPAGTVPVLIFGHGIFGDPASYLNDPADPSGLLQLADEAGFIVVATTWTGLSSADLGLALGAASDFGRFPELTDHLVQAQVNVRVLADVAAGLLEDPSFAGESGQSLPDPEQVHYYGISLGAIEGLVFAAHDPPVDRVALHVGGASWSTMLERSSNWPAFEFVLAPRFPNAADRQVLYAVTQLWWDPVDPLSYVDRLATRELLLQEAIGDEQVPNLTTHTFARGVGLPVLTPVADVPYGLDSVASGASALVRFDPQLPLPPPENRPAPVTGAHETPRTWTGAREQVVRYLQGEGVVHLCGDAPCSAANTGDAP
jgi:hypothetical protein